MGDLEDDVDPSALQRALSRRLPLAEIVDVIWELTLEHVDYNECNVLHHIVLWDRVDVCRYVLTHPKLQNSVALICEGDKDDMTPLDYAAMAGSFDCVIYLLSWRLSQSVITDALIRVAAARCEHQRDIAMSLLLAGADVNGTGFYGRRALHTAVREGNVLMISICIENGHADVNVTDDFGLTPLHHAAHTDQPEAATALVRAGASARASDPSGLTALHLSARANSVDVMEILLDSDGSLVDVVDDSGDTALHYAVTHKSTAAVTMLLSYNANPLIRNAEGCAPFTIAETSPHISNLLHHAAKAWTTQRIHSPPVSTTANSSPITTSTSSSAPIAVPSSSTPIAIPPSSTPIAIPAVPRLTTTTTTTTTKTTTKTVIKTSSSSTTASVNAQSASATRTQSYNITKLPTTPEPTLATRKITRPSRSSEPPLTENQAIREQQAVAAFARQCNGVATTLARDRVHSDESNSPQERLAVVTKRPRATTTPSTITLPSFISHS